MAEEQTSLSTAKTICKVNRYGSNFAKKLECLEGAEGEEQKGSKVSEGGASVEKSEEDPRGRSGLHGKVNELHLEDSGVGRPTSSMADVRQSYTDGVGS